ncbi:general substrate transporter [Trichoderma velutinum]
MKESTNITNILSMAGFSGLLIGFNLSSMSGILDVMAFSDGESRPFQREFITSVIPFCSILGALLSWHVVDGFGAPKTLRYGTLLWLFGSFLMAVSGGLSLLSIGRGIAGVGGRILSAIVPAYQVEIAPKDRRGSLMSLLYLFISGGIMLQYGTQFAAGRLMGKTIHRNDSHAVAAALRITYLLQIIPGLFFLMFTLLLPRSPYHLAYRGRWREAHELMAALEKRGTTDPKVLAHYEQMRHEILARRRDGDPQLRMLFRPSERNKLMVGAYHTSFVMASAGILWLPLALFLVYLFNIISTGLAGSKLADLMGRRLTLFFGSFAMILCLVIMGVLQDQYAELNLGYFEGTFFDDIPYVIKNIGASHAVMVFATLFVLTYAATWGPTSGTYSTEIFSTYLRSRAVGLCTACYWFGNLIMTFAVPRMLDDLDTKTYFMFAFINGFAFIHVLAAFRETQGGPLEEMDDLFNSDYYAWQSQPRGVKFEYLVSRFENHPAVVGNATGPESDIELEPMENRITNGAAV